MKFGTQLKAHLAPHWKYHFVDYDGLKALLKSKSHEREFTEQDEAQFVQLLNAELDKVASFQALKLGEVQRRTEHCEFTIEQHQLPSSKSSERLTLASFVVTESEINKITQDLQDLARFQRLNYTAFLKIVKKHDKHTGFLLRANFMNQQLNSQPFHKESFASLVSRLSTLYNIVRTGTAPDVTKAQTIDSEEDEELEQSGCIGKKTAFWVHPDNVMDLKMLILKYLPLVVYEPTPSPNSSHRSTSQLSSYLTSESPVSTIYLDNQDFDLYMGQVEHRERSETVRLRWYGSEKKQMWVEHQKRSVQSAAAGSTTTASSSSSATTPPSNEPIVTKHRFQIKSKYVPKLVQGTAKMDKALAQLRRSGQKTEQEIRQFEDSTRIVQSRIKKRQLQPVIQTFFNRTAFQVPGDARVRITIDTDVVMVKERGIESSDLYDRPWHPTELQAEKYPFSHVREQDIVRFPYAIMQIRTLLEPHQEVPSWVEHIGQSHLVEMVPNFAKDQHAIATLFDSCVGLLPFWLSDMDRDIRKPAMLTGGFPRQSTTQDSNSNSGSNDTLSSGQSTAATTISDSGSPICQRSSVIKTGGGSSKKQPRSRKSILDSQEIYTPGVTFDEQVQDLMAVNRMTIDNQGPSQAPAQDDVDDTSKLLLPTSPKGKKPVVSCLKKHGSFSSLQSRSSFTVDPYATIHGSSGTGSEGYGSASSTASSPTSRKRKRVTFKKSTARHWFDSAFGWIPLLNSSSNTSEVDDLEAQQICDQGRGKGRFSAGQYFWTGLSIVNIGLLFVGLVLALINLGDSVGLEEASLFLIVSCLCMGTTVWAHLIRMDGHDADVDLRGDDDSVPPYLLSTDTAKATERTGLLFGKGYHQSQYSHAAHKGRWVRTRLLPMLTFLSLAIVVGLNAAVRMRPLSEEVGSD